MVYILNASVKGKANFSSLNLLALLRSVYSLLLYQVEHLFIFCGRLLLKLSWLNSIGSVSLTFFWVSLFTSLPSVSWRWMTWSNPKVIYENLFSFFLHRYTRDGLSSMVGRIKRWVGLQICACAKGFLLHSHLFAKVITLKSWGSGTLSWSSMSFILEWKSTLIVLRHFFVLFLGLFMILFLDLCLDTLYINTALKLHGSLQLGKYQPVTA